MLKISWIGLHKISNQQLLDSIQEERTLVDSMHQRKHKWLGHILRHDGLLHTMMEGRIEGKRGKGHKRQHMTDDIMGKENCVSMKRTAENRTRWIARRQQHIGLYICVCVCVCLCCFAFSYFNPWLTDVRNTSF